MAESNSDRRDGPVGSDSNLEERYVRLVLEVASGSVPRARLIEILEGALETVDGERGFLFLFRKSGGFQVLAARDRDHDEITDASERMSHYAVARMLESGSIVSVADARRDRRYRTADGQDGKRVPVSIHVFPLVAGGALVGGVYIDHRFRILSAEDTGCLPVQRWIGLCALALEVRELGQRVRSLERDATRAQERAGETPPEREETKRVAQPIVARAELTEFHGMHSANVDMLDLFEAGKASAASDLPVVIVGETGTGKGLLARAIHLASPRASGPFVVVPCGAISDSLVESELHGHEKGAFTGAEREHHGLLSQADGGTLLLDDVDDMSAAMQAQLLRFLEDGTVRRLGTQTSHAPRRVDARVLAASSQGLEALVASGGFRRDLFFRLKSIELVSLPLRERPEDIPGLFDLALARGVELAGGAARSMPLVSDAALERIVRYPWPGNVRELENEAARLASLGLEEIRPESLSSSVRSGRVTSFGSDPIRLDRVVAEAEQRAIAEALRQNGGNKSRAAAALGITRKALYRRLAKHRTDG